MGFIEKFSKKFTYIIIIPGIFILILCILSFLSIKALELYLEKYGENYTNATLITLTFLVPPILTYFIGKLIIKWTFITNGLEFEIPNLKKVKDFFSNSSIVLIAVLTVSRSIYTPTDSGLNNTVSIFKDPLKKIEESFRMMLDEVIVIYLFPVAFAIMSFLFGYLESEIEKNINNSKKIGQTKTIIMKNKKILELENIIIEMNKNITLMKSELETFKRVHKL